MYKKILLVLFLFVIMSGSVFAQSEYSPYRNTFAVTVDILGIEGSYELMLGNHFSMLLSGFYNNMFFFDKTGAALKARVYPFKGIFHLDLGLGYIYGRGYLSGSTSFMLLVITFGLIGGNVIFPKEGGFLVQPGLGWKIPVGINKNIVIPIDLGFDIRASKIPDVWLYSRIGLGFSF